MAILDTCEEDDIQRAWDRYYLSCSKCGGEKYAEGWCANYCTDDDPVVCACTSSEGRAMRMNERDEKLNRYHNPHLDEFLRRHLPISTDREVVHPEPRTQESFVLDITHKLEGLRRVMEMQGRDIDAGILQEAINEIEAQRAHVTRLTLSASEQSR